MCLIFVAMEAHPDYQVIIAANRDEYFDRPSTQAAFWPEAPHLLAGKDLRGGGTWLGITRTGRIAALTNYRHPEATRPEAPSRGNLVSGFLLGDARPLDYLSHLAVDAHRYNGFNLLVAQNTGFYCYSNQSGGIQQLEPGIHGLSNHLLDTPWPKVEKGKQALRALLAAKKFGPEDLLEFLSDRTAAPDDLLPDTGVGLDAERLLSPIFISSPGYGTRSSTVILLDRSGNVTLIEKSFSNESGEFATVEYSFSL